MSFEPILRGLEDRLGLPNTGLLPPIIDRINAWRKERDELAKALEWCTDRLIVVYGESPNVDYNLKHKAIAKLEEK